MKSKIRFVFMLVLVAVLLAACSPLPAFTSADAPPAVLDVILALAIGFASLIGVSNLVAVLVQFGKLVGLIKDGTANNWAAGLNIVAFGALVYFGVFQPQLAVSVLDGYAAQIAEILLFLLGLFIQLTGSKPAYDAFKASRVPLLNYSHPRS